MLCTERGRSDDPGLPYLSGYVTSARAVVYPLYETPLTPVNKKNGSIASRCAVLFPGLLSLDIEECTVSACKYCNNYLLQLCVSQSAGETCRVSVCDKRFLLTRNRHCPAANQIREKKARFVMKRASLRIGFECRIQVGRITEKHYSQ